MGKKFHILLVSSRKRQLEEFTRALAKDPDVSLSLACTIQEAIKSVERFSPDMVIIDQEVAGVDGLDMVKELLKINAFIASVLLSDEDETLFHERSEGLGLLGSIPLEPSKKDAIKVLEKLRRVVPH